MIAGLSIGGMVAGVALDQALKASANYVRDDEEIVKKLENERYEEAIEEMDQSDVQTLVDGVQRYVKEKKNKNQLSREEQQELDELEKQLRAKNAAR